MGHEEANNISGGPKRTPEDFAKLLKDAIGILRDVQPIVDEVKLREARMKLNQQLFTRFNLGTRIGKSREIQPCPAVGRLFSGLDALNVPIPHQIRIIDELTTAVEGVYHRATHDYLAVPDNTLKLAANMWVYSTLAFTAIDKARGRLK